MPVDGAMRHLVGLLELIRREDDILAQLGQCIADLKAIRAARLVLLDATDSELTELADTAGATSIGPPIRWVPRSNPPSTEPADVSDLAGRSATPDPPCTPALTSTFRVDPNRGSM